MNPPQPIKGLSAPVNVRFAPIADIREMDILQREVAVFALPSVNSLGSAWG
jgi:hypothetical protein